VAARDTPQRGSAGRRCSGQRCGRWGASAAARTGRSWKRLGACVSSGAGRVWRRFPSSMSQEHSFMVALLAWAHCQHTSASEESRGDESWSEQRIANGVFGAVFHDIGEALTRDVINPVKRGGRIEQSLRETELDSLAYRLWPHVPKCARPSLEQFAELEFDGRRTNHRCSVRWESRRAVRQDCCRGRAAHHDRERGRIVAGARDTRGLRRLISAGVMRGASG
jgi:hypothetical protein